MEIVLPAAVFSRKDKNKTKANQRTNQSTDQPSNKLK